MYFDLSSVIFLMLFAAGGGFWWKAKAAQERALKAARNYCEQMGLQLLDGCVSESSWHINRDAGKLCLLRKFQFEFTSTGHERYNGEVIMKGNRLQQVQVAPYRVQ